MQFCSLIELLPDCPYSAKIRLHKDDTKVTQKYRKGRDRKVKDYAGYLFILTQADK